MGGALRRAAAVCVTVPALGVGFAAWAPAAGAVSGVQTGYWQQRPGLAQVPAGGFEVSSDPSGAQAVAAIRFTLDPGESAPVLTLKLAQALPQASQVAILVCPANAKTAGWKAGASAGTWASRPVADCSGGSAVGKLSADGSAMTFDLGSVTLSGSAVDLVLQPDVVASPVPPDVVPGAGGNQNPTFDAAFAPMTPGQVTVTQTAVAPPPPVTSGGAAAGASTGSSSGSARALAASLPATSGLAGPTSSVAPAIPAAPPVVAPSPQPVAQAGPLRIVKHRNQRVLFAIAMLSADVLFVFLWLQRREETVAGHRPLLSIYDPPPAPTPNPELS